MLGKERWGWCGDHVRRDRDTHTHAHHSLSIAQENTPARRLSRQTHRSFTRSSQRAPRHKAHGLPPFSFKAVRRHICCSCCCYGRNSPHLFFLTCVGGPARHKRIRKLTKRAQVPHILCDNRAAHYHEAVPAPILALQLDRPILLTQEGKAHARASRTPWHYDQACSADVCRGLGRTTRTRAILSHAAIVAKTILVLPCERRQATQVCSAPLS